MDHVTAGQEWFLGVDAPVAAAVAGVVALGDESPVDTDLDALALLEDALVSALTAHKNRDVFGSLDEDMLAAAQKRAASSRTSTPAMSRVKARMTATPLVPIRKPVPATDHQVTLFVDLLGAAGRRELVLVTDVIDRTHVVLTSPDDQTTTDLSPADCQRLVDMFDHNLVQLGDIPVDVPWYGGGTARGYRLLPTALGLARLDTEFVELPYITSHAIAGVAA